MANVIRDPKDYPDAILPDLLKPNPLVHFTKEDVAFVYGSRWKQRYFKKVGKDYFVFPAQWDVTHQIWQVFELPQCAWNGEPRSAHQTRECDLPGMPRS